MCVIIAVVAATTYADTPVAAAAAAATAAAANAATNATAAYFRCFCRCLYRPCCCCCCCCCYRCCCCFLQVRFLQGTAAKGTCLNVVASAAQVRPVHSHSNFRVPRTNSQNYSTASAQPLSHQSAAAAPSDCTLHIHTLRMDTKLHTSFSQCRDCPSPQVTCTLPALAAGAYTVQLLKANGERSVVDPNGGSAAFLSQPYITGLTASFGSVAGGNPVTITTNATVRSAQDDALQSAIVEHTIAHNKQYQYSHHRKRTLKQYLSAIVG